MDTHKSECFRCRQRFQSQCDLQRHLLRKNQCEEGDELPIKKHRCIDCGKTYSARSSLSRHRSGCSSRKKSATTDASSAAASSSAVASTSAVAATSLSAVAPTSAAAANTAATLTSATIMPVSEKTALISPLWIDDDPQVAEFGKENIRRITHLQMWNLLSDVIKINNKVALHPEQAEHAILKTAKLIYGDLEHPEDMTCYLPAKCDVAAMVHLKDGWQLSPIGDVYQAMIRKSLDVIFDKQPGFGGKDVNDMSIGEQRWFHNECCDFLRYLKDEEETLVSKGSRRNMYSLLYCNRPLIESRRFARAPR